MNKKRKHVFDKNRDLESLASEINQYLIDFEKKDACLGKSRLPILLLVGAPRSGTTLMLQFLASTGAFAFPTNLMTRFYGSLRFASMVQLMLGDKKYDFQGEFSDVTKTIAFESKLGKTQGLMQPSEFWYFWRRFFNLDVPSKLSEESLKQSDLAQFVSELAEMERIFDRPVLLKALLLCFDLKLLCSTLNKPIFLHIKRNTIENARSLLKARTAYFGDLNVWYSTKPGEYEWLRSRSPFEQVLGQVIATNREIERQFSEIPSDQTIVIEYEEFCKQPNEVIKQINQRFTAMNYDCALGEDQDTEFEARSGGTDDSLWTKELLEANSNLERLKF